MSDRGEKIRLNGYQVDEGHAVVEAELSVMAGEEMLSFMSFTKEDYERNWHHEVIAKALDLFYSRKIKNLMLFMPPRVGKTESVSRRFPAFVFGRNPKAQIISTSYSDALASSANRDVQRIIDTEIYRLIYPQTTLSGENVRSDVRGSWLRNNNVFEIVGHGGYYRSAGIGSGITGRGFNYGVIDDPIKNWQEALSPTVRQKHWDWYTSTFYTRREKDAGICLIMTRWHEDDLAGRIIAHAKQTGEDWTILSFPMLKESAKTGYEDFYHPILSHLDPRSEGDPLWPNKYSLQECNNIRAAVGSRVWAGLYQQRPAPEKGALVKRDWFKFYRELPAEVNLRGEWLQSWDLSFKGGSDTDFVVGQVWAKVGAQKYLIDQVRARMAFNETITAIRSMTAKWPKAHLKLIEDKANGPAVINSLENEIPGIVGVKVSDSKIARLNAAAPDFEAGNVLVPSPEQAPWIHDWMEEMIAFPQSAHDDQVDAATQALLRFRDQSSGDFSEKLIPKSNVTISGQRGKRW